MPSALAIIAHPDRSSFNHALLSVTRDACQTAGYSLTVNDLYASNFDPIARTPDLAANFGGELADDVREQQHAIASADLLIFHHPVWWFDRPAILKGWFDRVFTLGFAFTIGAHGTEGLLNDKTALVIQTAGVPEAAYACFGAKKDDLTPYPGAGIGSGSLEYCGISTKVLTHYGMMSSDKGSRSVMINRTRAALETLLSGTKS